jgi:hypothetical protein
VNSWAGIDSEVSEKVRDMSDANLRAATEQPVLISEWSKTEQTIYGGGYEGRTIHELIQNGADEILRWVQDPARPDFESGRVRVLLTPTDLYCANEGAPISRDGVQAMLSAFNSGKRGDQIGRFGVGFKAVLQVTDQPEFYSTTGSFRFSNRTAKQQFNAIDGESEWPVLRTATPIDFETEIEENPILAELAEWGASSIVKLQLKPKTAGVLEGDIKNFDGEFLLFSPHVTSLHLETRIGKSKVRDLKLELERSSNGKICREEEETTWSGTLLLTEGNSSVKWLVATKVHQLSQLAMDEAGPIAQRERVPVTWAVPASGTSIGRFWAFFSTDYETTLSGILNAPWKTNNDRTNLHSAGEGDRDKDGFTYNGELLDVATDLVISSIPELQELWPDDHCRFLLALPGRFDGPEPKNWADRLLSEKVYRKGHTSPILPDQSG